MKHQKGAVLIVVLALLLVITLIGTYAIKQSLTSLNIATNSQARQLLFQSADAPLYLLSSGGMAQTVSDKSSVLGYAANNAGNEVVFCFRNSLLDLPTSNNTSLLVWNDSQTDVSNSNSSGFCNASTSTDFASARGAQITQVTVIAMPNTSNASTNKPFSGYVVGTDTNSVGSANTALTPTSFRVYVTSLLPAISTASTSDINACLRRPSTSPISGTATTISSCLSNLGIPFVTQIQDFQQNYCVNGSGCS